MAKNNESIYERDNSYFVKIFFYDESGNRTSYSKSFKFKKYGTKQKALAAAKKHRDDMRVRLENRMVIQSKRKYTLDEVFTGMMEIYNCSLDTKKKVQGTYNRYIRSFIGENRDFSSIKFDDIQKSLNSMVSTCKDDTIIRTKSIWKRLFNYAMAKEIVFKDETFNVITPKSDIITVKKPMETTYEEMMETINLIDQRIRNRRDSELLQGAILIMYYTGMRPAEVMALDEKNIDLDNMTIYVCQAVGSTTTEKIAIKKTKTELSIRYIPIMDGLVPILEKLMDQTVDGLLFMRDNGKLMNGNFLSSVCQRLTGHKFRPYTLRHQFSTDLITGGTDQRTVMELMGHKNIDMTLGYARSNKELKRNALEARKMS